MQTVWTLLRKLNKKWVAKHTLDANQATQGPIKKKKNCPGCRGTWCQKHSKKKQLHWLLLHRPSRMLERRIGITNKGKQNQRQKAYTAPLARRRCRACRCALERRDAAAGAAELADDAPAGAPP